MTDFICLDDMDPMAGELDDPVAELEQDLYHRLITPPGRNIDDPAFGLGLEDMLSGFVDNSLASRIEAEFKKDDRVDSVDVAITQTAVGVFRIDIEIQPTGALLLEADTKAGLVRRLAT